MLRLIDIESGQALRRETAMGLTSPNLALTVHFDVVEFKYQVQLSICCPVERQQTTSNQIKLISLEPGKGLWWRCLCCNGWHIIVLPEEMSIRPDLWPVEEW